jgi:hypothetical protein
MGPAGQEEQARNTAPLVSVSVGPQQTNTLFHPANHSSDATSVKNLMGKKESIS